MGFVNYKNGNYVVYFNVDTGDKIRNTRDSEFIPAFAENCDITITNKCDGSCKFCYAGCTPNGKHGDLNASFLDTLHPYTELAINGNDLSHPNLIPFLEKMENQKVFVNITVNQKHFESLFDKIRDLQNRGLIHGIGVSLNSATPTFLDCINNVKNVIVHVINGVVSIDNLNLLIDQDIDLLILGYKTTGRGSDYLDKNRDSLKINQLLLEQRLPDIFKSFKTVAFDNLALDQLNVKPKVSSDTWDTHYMGDDGDFTFFINLVEGYFARNSTSDIHYPLLNDIDEMFNVIKKES